MIQKPYKHKKHNRCSKAIGSLNKNPNRTDKPPDLGKANISFSFSFFSFIFLLFFFIININCFSLIFAEEGIVDHQAELRGSQSLDLKSTQKYDYSRNLDNYYGSEVQSDSSNYELGKYIVEKNKKKFGKKRKRKLSFSHMARTVKVKSKKVKSRTQPVSFSSMAKKINKNTKVKSKRKLTF